MFTENKSILILLRYRQFCIKFLFATGSDTQLTVLKSDNLKSLKQ